MLHTHTITLGARATRALKPRRPGASSLSGRLAALGLGFSTIVVQTLVLRELMVTWHGDETSFGIALAAWLLSAGLGSTIGGRRFASAAAPRTRLAGALALLGILAPLSVLAARVAPHLLGSPAGELAGPGLLLVAVTLSAGPFAFAAGAAFSLTIKTLAPAGATERRSAAARVYALEAAGAVCSGVLLSFVFIPNLAPLTIAGLCALVLSATALTLARGGSGIGGDSNERRTSLALIVTGLVALVLISPFGELFDGAIIRAQWSDLGFVLSHDSVHGRVVAARRGTQLSVYESGVLAGSAPDLLTAEESVHIPMLEHPAPESVLLVGGGLGGSIAEVLRHPTVRRVDYVELDPALLRAAREAFQDSLLAGLSDARVRLHYGDARRFIRTSDSRYDVIIINVPDPVTTQINRLYTAEFFGEARRLLRHDGIVGLTVSGSENFVPRELAELLVCLEATLASAFTEVVLLPGDPCHLIAGGPNAHLVRDGAALASEVERRGIRTLFIARHYLEDRFSAARIADFDTALERSPATGLNRDLRPRGYFAALVLWSRRLGSSSAFLEIGRRVVGLPALAALGVLLAVIFGAVPRLRGRSSFGPVDRATPPGASPFDRAVVLSVVVVGFSEMCLEIAAIIAYQSLYGYVYGRLALITASFMAGLALGGWLGTRLSIGRDVDRTYVLLQCGLAAVPVAFGLAVARLGCAAAGGAQVVAAFFPALVASSAVLAGIQFPLAASILLRRNGALVARQGGALYASDLFGAALGALAASLLLLPVMGTTGTMTGLAVLNVSVCVALVLTRPPGRKRSGAVSEETTPPL